MQIGQYFAKLWRFVYFQNGFLPPSWILREVAITLSSLLRRVFLQLYQIWLHYLILQRRCDQNNLIQPPCWIYFRFTFWHIFTIRNTNWINFRGRSQNLRRHGQNRLLSGCDIVIKPKSNMAAAAILNLVPVRYLTHFEDYRGKMCLHTKFHANRTIWRSYNVS